MHKSVQIDILGEVVEAVKGRVEVYLDGGVRQGTDVLKALALGAKAVFIGRPVLWGLSYQVCHSPLYWTVCINTYIHMYADYVLMNYEGNVI